MTPSEVFVVGCGRSGTTLLFELLAAHRSFSWISNWSDRSGVAGLRSNGVYRSMRGRGLRPGRGAPRPSEGYRAWRRCIGDFRTVGERTAEEVTDTSTQKARGLVHAHCRPGQVYLSKNTGMTRQVGYFAAMFPDALFVHVVRSPLDTVASLLEVAWWPDLPLWTHDGATPKELAATRASEANLAGELWAREAGSAREAGAALGEKFLQVRYEDVVRAPQAVTDSIVRRVQLPPDLNVDQRRRAIRITSRAGSWQGRLSTAEREAAWAQVGQLARSFGYLGKQHGHSGGQ